MFKTLMAGYMAATLAWSLAYRQLGAYSYGWKFFLYYTHWSYTVLVVWALLDFALVVRRHNSETKDSRPTTNPFWTRGKCE